MNWQTILARWDDDFCVESAERHACVIPNGRFTVTLPDGGHRTLKIHTKGGHGKFAGYRIISLLTRPDNNDEYSYIGFGFVSETGIRPWKTANKAMITWGNLLWNLATGSKIAGYGLLIEKRCLVCNQTLTTPESISSGLGPSCRKRLIQLGHRVDCDGID